MKNLIKQYSQISNKSSGLVTLALIQAVVMAASRARVDSLTGTEHWVMFIIMLLSTLGFAASCLGIAGVIKNNKNTKNWEKFLISAIFFTVYIGTLLSAFITTKAMF